MRCFDKRGQLTIFIMVGLVLLMSAGLVLISQNKASENDPEVQETIDLPLKFVPFKTYVDDCFRKTTHSGSVLLAMKGGFIYSFDQTFNASGTEVAYHLIDDQAAAPEKTFMQEELSRFIGETLPRCVIEEKMFNHMQITFGTPTIKTTILDEKISVTADFPIRVKESGDDIELTKFHIETDSKLGIILDIADELKAYLLTTDQVSLEKLSSYDADISILPYTQDTVVYGLLEKNHINDPILWMFAVKKTN